MIGKYNLPNGIGISPDGRMLYSTHSTRGWIAHTLDALGNKPSERVLINLQRENIGPPGDGYLYIPKGTGMLRVKVKAKKQKA